MAKANDKKVVRHAHSLLLSTIGNLLESHRERRFRHAGKAQSRAVFCAQHGLVQGNVAFIETGRFLSMTFPQLRHYLAVTYGSNDAAFATSAKKVYDGLKEMDRLLQRL
jgi:hypothetical protein